MVEQRLRDAHHQHDISNDSLYILCSWRDSRCFLSSPITAHNISRRRLSTKGVRTSVIGHLFMHSYLKLVHAYYTKVGLISRAHLRIVRRLFGRCLLRLVFVDHYLRVAQSLSLPTSGLINNCSAAQPTMSQGSNKGHLRLHLSRNARYDHNRETRLPRLVRWKPIKTPPAYFILVNLVSHFRTKDFYKAQFGRNRQACINEPQPFRISKIHKTTSRCFDVNNTKKGGHARCGKKRLPPESGGGCEGSNA